MNFGSCFLERMRFTVCLSLDKLAVSALADNRHHPLLDSAPSSGHRNHVRACPIKAAARYSCLTSSTKSTSDNILSTSALSWLWFKALSSQRS